MPVVMITPRKSKQLQRNIDDDHRFILNDSSSEVTDYDAVDATMVGLRFRDDVRLVCGVRKGDVVEPPLKGGGRNRRQQSGVQSQLVTLADHGRMHRVIDLR